MEELSHAVFFRAGGYGIQFCKCHPCKARGRRKVTRQPKRAHPPAIGVELKFAGKQIFRLPWRELHIIIQGKHLLVKGRIICQHAHRVFVNLQTVCYRFDGDSAAFIGDNPVKLGRRQRIAVRSTHQIHAGNKISGLSQSPTLAQQPGNEFVLSNVSASVFYIAVDGVSHKVQPCYAEPHLVDRIIVKRIIVCDMSHADNGIVRGYTAAVAKLKRIIPGHNRYLFPI